eukprot:CAMPEP_0115038758 /NCGR_PEP_ID=MMETSP0216-20121206/43609_1 /TAXON_ID=223996 /ORGANISM="Protocruzia adherens, Strain Boccale" /LENGTH=519 /DNA_ID=CAMNT_0002419239 /DNA_START=164 /DNA_END=1723 /DNA_ORIENTATION=-
MAPKRKKQRIVEEDVENTNIAEETKQESDEESMEGLDKDMSKLQFEDDVGDEFEEEEWLDDGEYESDEEVKEEFGEGALPKSKKVDKGEEKKVQFQPFLGNEKDLAHDEVLDYDNRAYELFFRTGVEWPCLSLDSMVPEYYSERFDFQTNPYPYTLYVVAGSQATGPKNKIYVTKLSKLFKTKYDDDEASGDSDHDDDDETDPIMEYQAIPVDAAVNRIRCSPFSGVPLVATWLENGDVSIWDISPQLEKIEEKESFTKQELKSVKNRLCQFRQPCEGYALEWSHLSRGLLATGNCNGLINLYQPSDANLTSWNMDQNGFTGHTDSVEDLQFSPKEANVFASCSADKTVRVWDMNASQRSKPVINIDAHKTDVNVISWNHLSDTLIASGSDDGSFKVWDLRFPKDEYFESNWHSDQITSIQFHPKDDSVLTVSSADHKISIWDLSIEPDDNEMDQNEVKVPHQLVFLHQGLQSPKEVRHHCKYSDIVLATGENGFNVFRPSYDPESDDEEDYIEREILN